MRVEGRDVCRPVFEQDDPLGRQETLLQRPTALHPGRAVDPRQDFGLGYLPSVYLSQLAIDDHNIPCPAVRARHAVDGLLLEIAWDA